MSKFYEQYKDLFEGGSGIPFPSKNRKFSHNYTYDLMKPRNSISQDPVPQKQRGNSVFPSNNILPSQSIQENKKFKPLKAINFDPNPRSRDPLKWNFNRALEDRKSYNDNFNKINALSLPSMDLSKPEQRMRNFRGMAEVAKPASSYTPFATHEIEEKPKSQYSSYSISAPYGMDVKVQQKKQTRDEEAYKIHTRAKHGLRSHSQSPITDHPIRGAGMSYKEIQKHRDHEITLKNDERRFDSNKARSLFDKSEITNTLAFRVKKSDLAEDAKSHAGSIRALHNRMLANKVRGEQHFKFGDNDNPPPTKSLDKKLPYGEPSKNCPNVPIEESLNRRKEAKKYLKERQLKLKALLNKDSQ
ncbi:unnamed protein product [Moneuplotes crassus]|uniref:Uncharacterized protein n=1 Tax=Euplotes crassus TaxID=5936 RepID=A0AAD2CWS3_EUPCR|nr:unnamed protein product [Moneuplotes crassus]